MEAMNPKQRKTWNIVRNCIGAFFAAGCIFLSYIIIGESTLDSDISGNKSNVFDALIKGIRLGPKELEEFTPSLFYYKDGKKTKVNDDTKVSQGTDIFYEFSFSPIDAANKNIEISVSDENLVKVAPSKNALECLQDGHVTITFTSVSNPELVMTSSFEISTNHIGSFWFPADSYVGEIGDHIQLEPQIVPSDAIDPTLLYESTNTKVAEVSDLGEITLVGPGYADIIVRNQDKTSCNWERVIRVDVGLIKGVSLFAEEAVIDAGNSFTIDGAIITGGRAADPALIQIKPDIDDPSLEISEVELKEVIYDENDIAHSKQTFSFDISYVDTTIEEDKVFNIDVSYPLSSGEIVHIESPFVLTVNALPPEPYVELAIFDATLVSRANATKTVTYYSSYNEPVPSYTKATGLKVTMPYQGTTSHCKEYPTPTATVVDNAPIKITATTWDSFTVAAKDNSFLYNTTYYVTFSSALNGVSCGEQTVGVRFNLKQSTDTVTSITSTSLYSLGEGINEFYANEKYEGLSVLTSKTNTSTFTAFTYDLVDEQGNPLDNEALADAPLTNKAGIITSIMPNGKEGMAYIRARSTFEINHIPNMGEGFVPVQAIYPCFFTNEIDSFFISSPYFDGEVHDGMNMEVPLFRDIPLEGVGFVSNKVKSQTLVRRSLVQLEGIEVPSMDSSLFNFEEDGTLLPIAPGAGDITFSTLDQKHSITVSFQINGDLPGKEDLEMNPGHIINVFESNPMAEDYSYCAVGTSFDAKLPLPDFMKGQEVIYESLTPDTISINQRGRALALKQGDALVEAKCKRNESVSSIFSLHIYDSVAKIQISRSTFSGWSSDSYTDEATGLTGLVGHVTLYAAIRINVSQERSCSANHYRYEFIKNKKGESSSQFAKISEEGVATFSKVGISIVKVSLGDKDNPYATSALVGFNIKVTLGTADSGRVRKEFGHFFLFFLCVGAGLIAFFAFTLPRWVRVGSLVFMSIYGFIMAWGSESIQSVVPGRWFTWNDVWIDMKGALSAVLIGVGIYATVYLVYKIVEHKKEKVDFLLPGDGD